MKKIISSGFIILSGFMHGYAQNLVKNGDFSQTSVCTACTVPTQYPTQFSTFSPYSPEITKASFWEFGEATVISGAIGTADYYHVLGTGSVDVPACAAPCGGLPEACGAYAEHYVGIGLEPFEDPGIPQGESFKGQLVSGPGTLSGGSTYTFTAYVFNKIPEDVDLTVQFRATSSPGLVINALTITTVPVTGAGSCTWQQVTGTFTMPSIPLSNLVDRIEIGGYYNAPYVGARKIFIDRVEVKPVPVLLTTPNQTICEGDCATLSTGVPSSVANFATYNWVQSGVADVANPVVCPTTTTTYTCNITYGSQTWISTTTVFVQPLPNTFFNEDNACQNETHISFFDETPSEFFTDHYTVTGTTPATQAALSVSSLTYTHYFNASIAGVGDHVILVCDNTGLECCTEVIIHVYPTPPAYPSTTLCNNASPISLFPIPLPLGITNVTWSGNLSGVNQATHQFNPATATLGVNNFSACYQFPGGQCCRNYSFTVLPSPNVTTTLPTVMCVNDPIVKLGKKVNAFNTIVNSHPYFWSSGGTGVITSLSPGVSYPAFPPGFVTFNPALANIGANPITFTATATNGCSSSVTGIIYVCPPPTLNLQALDPCDPTTTITANATILPSGCPITYSWTGPGIVGSTTGSSINTNAYGTYTVTASTDPNCVTTQSITLTPPPSIGISSSDLTPCVGDIVTLSTNSIGPVTYSWTPNGETSPNITVTNSGTYCVTATNTEGCTSNPACINVVFTTPPPVNIIGDNTICQGANIQLTASIVGNCSSPSIQWLANGVPIAGANTPVLSIPSNTYAAGTIISVTICCNGCCATTNAATIIGLPTVSLNPVPVIDLCFDNTPVQLIGTSNGTNCFYSGPGTDPVLGIFDPLAAGGEGMYTVTYTCELNGCTNSASQNINVIENDFWHQTTKNTDFRDIGNDVITDAQGNVYITGLYIRKTTFAGGGNSDVVVTSGVGIPNFSFVAKYNSCADLMWVAYAVSGASGQPNLGNSITLDEAGGFVYAAGNFTNEIRYKSGQGDYGSSPLIFAFASAPGNNGYVARFNMSDGEALDITPIDLDDNTYATAITANETTGQIYVGGHHSGAANPGQDFLYVHKYIPLSAGLGIGTPTWTINGLGDGSHKVNDMDFNEADGSLWFIGDFKVELLLPPTIIVNGTLSSYDAYVARYADGLTPSLLTLKKGNMTGTGEMTGNGISINNANGNAFVTGNYFATTVNDAFENAGQVLPNASALNAYFMALDPNGNNIWSQPSFADAGTNAVRGKSVSYRNGKAYFTGTYNANAAFIGNASPTALPYNTSGPSTSQWHTYAAAFDGLNGSTIWLNATTDPFTNTSFHEGNSIATDNFGHAFITGSYRGTMGYQAGIPASGNLVSTLTGVNAFTMRVDLTANGEFRNETAEEPSVITTASNGIKVYPNPTSTQITLEIDAWQEEEKYEFTLTGIDGKIMLKKLITSSTTLIDLSELSSGVYFVTVQNGIHVNVTKLIKLD